MIFFWTALAVIVLVAVFLAFRSFRAAPLPAPQPWTGPLPQAAPPAAMAIFRLDTGTYENKAFLAYRGGSFSQNREFAATAVLIQHPAGDLLIDTGFGANVQAHIDTMPAYRRSPHTLRATVREQLRARDYDLARLRGVIITHAHWDHVSGLDQLPVPIWMNAAETRYVERAKDAQVFRDVSQGHEIHPYAFDGPAYLDFPASHDVFGDGSVVLVPAGGHTDGSVVIFVSLPDGRRFAFIGDLTWQCEGVTERAERPKMLRMLADVDEAEVRTGLLKIIALADRMHVVPAHDVGAFAVLPQWTAEGTHV